MLERTLHTDSQKDAVAETFFLTGHRLLNEYLPSLTPSQPTQTFFVKRRKPTFIGTYQGELRGTHYIFLNKVLRHYSSEEVSLEMVHELVHQWHAEQVGQKSVLGLTPDEMITNEEYEKFSAPVLFKKIYKKTPSNKEQESFRNVIIEGLPTFTEHLILQKQMETAIVFGNEKAMNELREYKKLIDYRIKTYQRSDSYFYRAYADGRRVINSIWHQGGIEAIISFIQSLDYEKLSTIMFDTQEYRQAIEDPLLLPRTA